jgi:hypothetical protein
MLEDFTFYYGISINDMKNVTDKIVLYLKNNNIISINKNIHKIIDDLYIGSFKYLYVYKNSILIETLREKNEFIEKNILLLDDDIIITNETMPLIYNNSINNKKDRIAIITITIHPQIYKLYIDYIEGIKLYIEKFKNIEVDIIFIENNDLKHINLPFGDYHTILFFGDYYIYNKIYNKYSYVYYVNIEQMSHPSYFKYFDDSVNKNSKIIDYSEENMVYHKNIYEQVHLFPPYFEEKNISNKKINILVMATNKYRTQFIDNLKNINCTNMKICFGNERDEIYNDTKIFINIHCSKNHRTMEMIRIVNLIMNKVIVISEPTVDINCIFLKKYILVCNTFEEIEITSTNILNDYDIFYKNFFKDINKDINDYIEYIKENIKNIIK